MKKKIGINFELNFNEIVQANKSFKRAKCAIAYAGENRNRSFISKETFEAALPSIKNIPLVGNYDIEKNQLGGHDLAIVTDSEGKAKLINATVPFGVVPESANQWWEEVDGVDYLWTDVLLWERSPITEYVVKNSKVAQSMEINVFDDKYEILDNGVCAIKEFEFEALCAIGVEPCFEEANVQIAQNYALSDYTTQFSMLLNDLKEFSKEGEKGLEIEAIKDEEKIEEAETVEEEAAVVEEAENSVVEAAEVVEKSAFVLMGEKREILNDAMYEQIEKDCWLMDFDEQYIYIKVLDRDKGMHCERVSYSIGENLEVSFGEAEIVEAAFITAEERAILDANALAVEDFAEYQKNHSYTDEQYQILADFKLQTETEAHNAEIDGVLEQFSDYSDISEYQELKKAAYSMEKSEVEEKCFAIKGRHGEIEVKAPKLIIDKNPTSVKANPYGNIF